MKHKTDFDRDRCTKGVYPFRVYAEDNDEDTPLSEHDWQEYEIKKNGKWVPAKEGTWVGNEFFNRHSGEWTLKLRENVRYLEML